MIRILVVCTGNICRSPMAEGLLRSALEERGCTGVEVASAGTWAMEGNPATSEAVAAIQARSVDISTHRARPVDPDEAAGADLILVMTAVHEREVLREVPEAASKTFLIRELAEMDEAAATGTTATERLASFLASTRPGRRAAHEVRDPYGLPFSAYERALADIEEGVLRLAAVICGPDGTSGTGLGRGTST